ncbi:related to ubiquitin-protein ligase [Cephalotrichum gorgonifer]|uniref:HECT-type E3 ubiquitin transferase n=1 Tax=Cephalotrichum gorgonifer TaxID=2041049 RepID=A0AAE8N3H8_9PEZI|nr:related to ubiquitin-protein ligase [Cephalotrichum gorgonifer]
MTREQARASHSGHPDVEIDLLALLWEEAPFPRLPRDAPPELKDFVQTIENPRHVYTIHKAARRHNFQSLVEKSVPSPSLAILSHVVPIVANVAFLPAGKAPIRRYNPTSARTLAVYMATQDDPERSLCPYLRIGKDTPVSAMNSLVISPIHPTGDTTLKAPSRQRSGSKGKERRQSTESSRDSGEEQASPHPAKPPGRHGRSRNRSQSPGNNQYERPAIRRQNEATFEVKEQPVRQDHRSFTTNMFGTVAFRMLEWLTPHSLDTLAKRVQDLSAPSGPEESSPPSPKLSSSSASQDPGSPASPRTRSDSMSKEARSSDAASPVQPSGTPAVPNKAGTSTNAANARRNSNAKVRAAATKPIRKLSTDPYVSSATAEDAPPTLVSPRICGRHSEKLPRPPKSSQAPNRGVSFAPPSPSGSSDDAEVERAHLTSGDEIEIEEAQDLLDDRDRTDEEGDDEGSQESEGSTGDEEEPNDVASTPARDKSPETSDPVEDTFSDDARLSRLGDAILPQSLSRLNFEVVEFLFNVLREDSTFESPTLLPRGASWQLQPGRLTRLPGMPTPYPLPMKQEWKRFIEQSVFYVMSDAHSLVRSFTKDGKLLDSRSLWRSMVRLTDAAPSLVFHSLWMATAGLFTLPKSFQPVQSPSTKSFPKTPRALTHAEAGHLVSICLHALAAAAPEVPNRTVLFDTSRLRSGGAILSGNGGTRSNPAQISLKYNDTFSNDLALRLARRLFSALVVRKHFAALAEFDDNVHDSPEDLDVLAPLMSQMDHLNSDAEISQNHSPTLQALPLLLIDWAKAVLMQDWDGQPMFNPDSAFGGAMLFIETMYERKQELLLADVNFRVEYLADRLDSASIPVDWLSFVPSRKRQHLLDRPFVFHPSNLVSYFRAINLSRMSRSYEEPSSVYERVRRFASDGLLGHQHRRVLQDMVRRAMSKYLILNVGRKTVVRDAFDQLWQREERELLRPLKVHLGEDSGEEGFDLGGVQQEFFKLVVAEIFDPSYGAFTVDERTRMAWFVPGSLVETWKYELVGVIFSLAVYNGLTLPVTLPKALYRKLLGEPVDELHHIADGWPELASGLTMLLEWDESDGTVEDIFARTYEFSVDTFGVPVSRDMQSWYDKPWPRAAVLPGSSRAAPSEENPADAPMVTDENRSAYVSDYIKFLTDLSVQPQYAAFERGFRACLHARSLDLLSPSILQSVVEGTQEIDLAELKRHTRYNGWDASHQTIRDFWSVVKRYDEPMKRRLLEFVTASDRVPVGGMQHVQFVIQRNGEEGKGGRLPTAYTCYGTLLLPEYEEKEVLRERLGMALANSQGFGFA